MIPFAKPGASDPYDVMGAAAAVDALADAGVDVRGRAAGVCRLRLWRFHVPAKRRSTASA